METEKKTEVFHQMKLQHLTLQYLELLIFTTVLFIPSKSQRWITKMTGEQTLLLKGLLETRWGKER